MTTTNDSAADLKHMLHCSRADRVRTGQSEPSPLALAASLPVNSGKEQPR
jgi:hypothetical protein